MSTAVVMPITRHPAPQPLAPAALSPRKEEILDGLERIILRDGFRSLRLTDVAKQLGASYTTLYQLAATRDELVMLVIDRWYQRNGQRTWPLVEASDDPVERLRIWIEGAQRGIEGVTGRFWDDVVSYAPITQLVQNYTHYYVSVLELLIEEGIDAGVFRRVNPRLAAMVFERAGAVLLDPEERRAVASYGPAGAAEFVDLIFGGLLAR